MNPGDVELDVWNGVFALNDGVEDDDAIIEARKGLGPPVIWGRSPPLRPGPLPKPFVAAPFVAAPNAGRPVGWVLGMPSPWV